MPAGTSAATSATGPPEPTIPRPATVVVVEDEDDQRALLTVLLGRCGCVVRAAANADTALELLAQEPVDLAMVDLRMPGKDGWALVDTLARLHPRCPVVVTSVLDADRYPPGATALPKPFTLAQLRTVLGTLLPRGTLA